jgi:hypothetical protein
MTKMFSESCHVSCFANIFKFHNELHVHERAQWIKRRQTMFINYVTPPSHIRETLSAYNHVHRYTNEVSRAQP